MNHVQNDMWTKMSIPKKKNIVWQRIQIRYIKQVQQMKCSTYKRQKVYNFTLFLINAAKLYLCACFVSSFSSMNLLNAEQCILFWHAKWGVHWVRMLLFLWPFWYFITYVCNFYRSLNCIQPKALFENTLITVICINIRFTKHFFLSILYWF